LKGKQAQGRKWQKLRKLRKRDRSIAVQLKRVAFNAERFYKQEPLFYRRKAKVKTAANFVTFFIRKCNNP
jgi:hypothetical protein